MIIRYLRNLLKLFRAQPGFCVINLLALGGAMVVIMVVIAIYVWIVQDQPLKTNKGVISEVQMYRNSRAYNFFKQEEMKLVNDALKDAEVLISTSTMAGSIVVKNEKEIVTIQAIDQNYSRYLNVDILAGANFTSNDYARNSNVVLLNAEVALRMGKADGVIGTNLTVRGKQYRIVGVFKPAIKRMRRNVQVYVPLYDSDYEKARTLSYYVHHQDGEEEILEQLLGKYDRNNEYRVISLFNQQLSELNELLVYAICFVGLAFMLPAMLLSYLTNYRMKLHLSELGLRKAFGATRMNIYWQLVAENVFFTLIAGVFALLLGQYFVSVLFHGFNGTFWRFDFPLYFFIIIVFSFLLLGIITAVFPARRIAHQSIINSLNSK